MTVHVYNLRLRTTRLASILRGVWLIAIAPGAAGVSDLHQREVTRDHGPIRALVSFALNRNLSANMRRAIL